ncbi:GNAT family N-acetyltransferase [Streptomyces sp. NPDC006290]|uniref:GNAT family N-acetyltransferase n=1 Tax=Streptomyces sp. NPDC006290 TaxID=3156745 RepID=UPI0033BE7B58
MSFSEHPRRDECSDHGFIVRELDLAEETTAAAVHRIGRRAYAVEADLIGFDGIPALRESLEEMRAQPLRWLGAVTDDGRVIAFVAWQWSAGEDALDIDRVCVDPTWFRRGLASRLLGHLLTDLVPSGYVLVSTGADNRPAVALYERLGFSRVGTVEPAPGLKVAQFRLTRDRAG